MISMTSLTIPTTSDRPERRFSPEEYLRMIAAGILTDHDKVELLEGRIVEKMPRNPPHEATLQRVFSLLMKICPPDWMVRVQASLRCRQSVPEPDAMIVRGPVDRYDQMHPAAEDALLVVEIADTSLRDDRHPKVSLYGGAGIPVYWIVNIVDRRVEVYTNPTGPDHFPTYRSRRDFGELESVELPFPGGPAVQIPVKDLLSTKKR
jgi:Uma2 family endonuclease